MIQNEEMEKINKGLLPLNIIWAAMLAVLFIYLLVGLFIEDNLRAATEKSVIATLRNVLFAVSFITLIATRFVRKLILYGTGRSTVISTNQPPYQSDQRPALSRYTSAMIVSLAMTESIGTYEPSPTMSQLTPGNRSSTSTIGGCCAGSITQLRSSAAGHMQPTCAMNTGPLTGSKPRPGGGRCRSSSDTGRCPDRH